METEKTIFKPCPICGAELTTNDIRIFDEEGEGGAVEERFYPEGACDFCVIMEDGFLLDTDSVDCVAVRCDCGFTYWAEACTIGFGERGWLKRFADEANRRV